MTPDVLRAICDTLNDERGTGGQSRLARMIGVDPRTIRNKLSGSTPITESDTLAIQKAVEMASGSARPLRRAPATKPL
jgi:DNA-binding transcriptional regulator YdaS (Cro superfamily)